MIGAVVQAKPLFGDVAHNLSHIEALVTEAAAQGAELVVVPELATSGYVWQTPSEMAAMAETVAGGQAVGELSELAARLGIHLVAGFPERDGDRLYNAALVTGPRGPIGTYRKTHVFDREQEIFTAGDSLPLFDLPFGKIGVVICYDLWFPETVRSLVLRGADYIVAVNAWIGGAESKRLEMGSILTMAQAKMNQVTILAADRTGTERGTRFAGGSLIASPAGWPLAGPAGGDETCVLVAPCPRRLDLRSSFSDYLKDRRPALYEGLGPTN